MNPFLMLLLLLAAVLSFGCAGMEAGVLTLSRWKIRQQVRKGLRRAKVLQRFLEAPEDFLWTILVGNTLGMILFFSMAFIILGQWFAGRPIWAVAGYVGAVMVFYLICDYLPKSLFRLFPNRLCLWAAMPFSLVHVSLGPVVRLIEIFSRLLLRLSGGKTFKGLLFANRRELREIMEESAVGFTTEEKRMINRVLDLQNISVRQVARGFGEFPVITPQTSVESVLKLAGEHAGNFWPVWHEELGARRLAGLLDIKSLLFDFERHKEKRVASLVASALFLDEDMTLEDALVRLQRAGCRLGVVLSKDKKEVGVVGTEEIFQVIFGKVRF